MAIRFNSSKSFNHFSAFGFTIAIRMTDMPQITIIWGLAECLRQVPPGMPLLREEALTINH